MWLFTLVPADISLSILNSRLLSAGQNLFPYIPYPPPSRPERNLSEAMSLLHRQPPLNPYVPSRAPRVGREPSPPLLASDILASLAQSGSPGASNPIAMIEATHSRQAATAESGVSMWGIPTELSSRSAHPLSREEAGRFYFPSSYYDSGSRSYRPALPRSPLLSRQQSAPLHHMLSQQEVGEFLSGGVGPQSSQVASEDHDVEHGLGVMADTNRTEEEHRMVVPRPQPMTRQEIFQHVPSVNGEAGGPERGVARAAKEWSASVGGMDPRAIQAMNRKRNGPSRRQDPKGKRPKRDNYTPQQLPSMPLSSSEDDEDDEDRLPAPPPLRARPVAPPQLRRGIPPSQPQLVPLRRGATNRVPLRPAVRPPSAPPATMTFPSVVENTSGIGRMPTVMTSLPSVAALVEATSGPGRLLYPRLSAVRPGSGGPVVSTSDDPALYSESPLPSRHSAPLPEPSRSEAGIQGSQSAPSVVDTSSSSSESTLLEFGHVRVKKEPGLEDSELREMHTGRVRPKSLFLLFFGRQKHCYCME